eukprot:Plantae.Rhodophyta-Hildenbrandia_rubra.ctg2244.p1 GENE.Plantae.Rhodophyta-Hildenbrandia_rubra.ctg2244~~Plantae.Rhodophyta-Hildenbrandia_rubra.ctg2244.p1  ORF type:complete len:331 (-),score=38.59 Plantae.Rhodophyta-Hildenbrandia_rubra.ctg2244:339-1229(-)
MVSDPGTAHPKYAHAIAGAGGGLLTVALLHPADTLRTRIQAAAYSRSPQTLFTTLHKLVVSEGPSALYKGVVPAMIGSSLSWACYFQCFDAARGVLRPRLSSDVVSNFISGGCAGVAVALATNPIWVVKVRLQLQDREHMRRGVVAYGGLIDTVWRIVREEGISGLYRGLVPSLALVSHAALQVTMYEWLKRHMGDGQGLKVQESLLASTISKVVASTSTYPLQVVRTRMQERGANQVLYKRLSTAFQAVFKQEGVRGLYRGLVANLIRVTPQAAVTFATYEQILKVYNVENFRNA